MLLAILGQRRCHGQGLMNSTSYMSGSEPSMDNNDQSEIEGGRLFDRAAGRRMLMENVAATVSRAAKEVTKTTGWPDVLRI
jgi:hypothetical protein